MSEVSFKKPNNGESVDKRGEKRGTNAVEDERQTSNQPLASAGRASGSKEVRRVYGVQWEQELFLFIYLFVYFGMFI